MAGVVIGMDPHKRSATIEVLDERERVLAIGRFDTDRAGYKQMLATGRRWPDRIWAVEGCEGVGRHLAQRLVADGEPVVDVPAKLSARVRVFSTGQGRKTDATDAHSVAVVAVRSPNLRAVQVDDLTVALRLLVDRRDELGAARTTTVNRLHRLLVELIPGGANKFLSATQARRLLATVRPRDMVGKTRRRLAAELVVELAGIDKRIKAANVELTGLVKATGSTLLELTRHRPLRRGPAARRHRGRGPLPDPRALRILEWHRTDRRLIRGPEPPSALSRREPADQPGAAHHGDRAAAQRDRGPGLLPPEGRRRQDSDGSHAVPETTPLRHRLPAARGRPETAPAGRVRGGPGRTLGGGY
jgi:transposase